MGEFDAGSGLDGAVLYTALAGLTVTLIWVWSMWVVYKSWKSTQAGRLPEGEMVSAWLQSWILASVLTALVLL